MEEFEKSEIIEHYEEKKKKMHIAAPLMAKTLKIFYDALCQEGFTNDQAISIVAHSVRGLV
jgi:hypothetical protein